MKFADRMDMFQEGIFSKLAHLKEEKIKEGMHVIDLSVGAPNIPPAKHIVDALIKQAGNLESYLYPLNDKEDLKQAVKVWYKNRYGVDIDPESEVTSLLGSQEGLAHIALSIVNPGDTVLVPDPCYPVFADGPRLAGAKLYYMPQREENGYIIDLDEIPEDIRREAKFMVVSYPNNPTTAMAPDSFYKKLIAFAKKYDIIVLHDNAYSDLVFDGNTCGSFLCYEGAKDVGVEFNSLSKTYGLAGARVGFCIGNKEVVKNLSNLKSNMDYGMFLPVQKAAIAAITGDQSCVETVRKAYENRRNILCDGLNEIGWKMNRCPATMFVWAKIPSKYTSSEKFCIELLDKTGVLVTPGSAFGPSGEVHVRMALVQDEDEMKKAIESIKNSDILK
ncbi:aminotransferase class I/II-fold pyridoxal phosphate-dependent enzyme [Anaerofustis sp. HA2171]|uniref:aminotransferase class I/II-fold pyridoxal phosphate-dependent enzyme n=1 Tax=Anaerofustis butyriciformans TaxID=3108533 RepID=UPI002E3609FD|nr:aminotransferase class I/II-fold pyridoxal phosphate-dependent enzyme [Anaerofustis sp. HA2171]